MAWFKGKLRRVVLPLLVGASYVGCLLLVVGCGGGSGTAAPARAQTTPPASTAFIKAADEVCRIGRGRRTMVMHVAQEAGKVGHGGKETLDQRHRRADLTWTLDQTMLGELELMKAATADKVAWKAFSEAMEERIASVRGSRSVAVASPKLDQLVAAYGLKDCSY